MSNQLTQGSILSPELVKAMDVYFQDPSQKTQQLSPSQQLSRRSQLADKSVLKIGKSNGR